MRNLFKDKCKFKHEKWCKGIIIYTYTWNIMYGSLTIETGQIWGINMELTPGNLLSQSSLLMMLKQENGFEGYSQHNHICRHI